MEIRNLVTYVSLCNSDHKKKRGCCPFFRCMNEIQWEDWSAKLSGFGLFHGLCAFTCAVLSEVNWETTAKRCNLEGDGEIAGNGVYWASFLISLVCLFFLSNEKEIILPFPLYFLMEVNFLHWKLSYVLKCKRQDTCYTRIITIMSWLIQKSCWWVLSGANKWWGCSNEWLYLLTEHCPPNSVF